jgi:hypothetical protein
VSDDRFVRAPHVLQRRTLEAFVLLAVEGDDPVVVGGTGADVWTLLAEPRALGDLVEFLAAHYAGEPDVIRRDVAELLEAFLAARVVQRLPT